MLKFFGRGSGFSDNHNCAFFIRNNSLNMLDCSLMAFIRLKNNGLEEIFEEYGGDNFAERIVVLVTHTHSDHVAGIPMLIHYAYFVWKIPVVIVAPCKAVKNDLKYYFDNMEGCNPTAYKLISIDDFEEYPDEVARPEWLKTVIPTTHVPELAGKCFGYQLKLDGRNVIYTGDTNDIKGFFPYLKDDSFLYTECSAIHSGVHTPVETLVEYKEFFEKKNVKVTLMHLDDEEKIRQMIADTDFEFAELI